MGFGLHKERTVWKRSRSGVDKETHYKNEDKFLQFIFKMINCLRSCLSKQ